MTVSTEHRERVLANQQQLMEAGNTVAYLSAANTEIELQDAWFAHCDHTEGPTREFLRGAFLRRLAQINGSFVPS